MAVSFNGAHFPQEIMLTGVRWYVAHPLSTRHVEELMLERGVHVDHSTINRWVITYSPQLEEAFHRRKLLIDRNFVAVRSTPGGHYPVVRLPCYLASWGRMHSAPAKNLRRMRPRNTIMTIQEAMNWLRVFCSADASRIG